MHHKAPAKLGILNIAQISGSPVAQITFDNSTRHALGRLEPEFNLNSDNRISIDLHEEWRQNSHYTNCLTLKCVARLPLIFDANMPSRQPLYLDLFSSLILYFYNIQNSSISSFLVFFIRESIIGSIILYLKKWCISAEFTK